MSIMDTLRGVFPKPKVLPKRDFIKENVQRMKEAQQVKRSQAANGTPALRGSSRAASMKPAVSIVKPRNQPRTNDQIIVIKEASENSKKGASSSALDVGRCSAASSTSRSSVVSTSREMSSQTGDINDDLFLKDVVIRIPSAKVLDQLNTVDNLDNGSGRRTVSSRTEKSVVFKWNETGFGVRNFEQQRNEHLSKLEEFSRKNSVSRKPFDDSTEFSEHDQIYVRNYRRATEMRKKQAVAKRVSQKQQDSPVYEEHKSVATGSSHSLRSLNYVGNGNPSSSAGSSRTAISKMDVPASYRFGELPRYLKEINENKAERRRVEAEIDPNCPEGHIALSEHERIEALEMADKSFQELVKELNKMPLTSQTLKMKHRKMEIEKELNEMEKTIRIFSRLKVYVKIDDDE